MDGLEHPRYLGSRFYEPSAGIADDEQYALEPALCEMPSRYT